MDGPADQSRGAGDAGRIKRTCRITPCPSPLRGTPPRGMGQGVAFEETGPVAAGGPLQPSTDTDLVPGGQGQGLFRPGRRAVSRLDPRRLPTGGITVSDPTRRAVNLPDREALVAAGPGEETKAPIPVTIRLCFFLLDPPIGLILYFIQSRGGNQSANPRHHPSLFFSP
jgi:hypothetical protein